MAISQKLSQMPEWELYLINRGNKNSSLSINIHQIKADINDEKKVEELLGDLSFDVVCDFIGFTTEHVERDYRLFHNRTRQYIFISSASAYQKPLSSPIINESTPLANPYWKYSRNKIACEEFLMKMYRENGFPITIVRPSHTYGDYSVPLGVHGKLGSWQVLKRMIEQKPVIIHGDGTSLWTMTHNSDFAKGFVCLMGNIHAIGEAFQITSDESLTWNQIYQTIANHLNVPLKACHISSEFLASTSDYDLMGSLIGDKANSVIFDNSKLKRVVPDFCATVRFDQGIRKTIEYVLTHKECQQEDKEFDEWCDKIIGNIENIKKNF